MLTSDPHRSAHNRRNATTRRRLLHLAAAAAAIAPAAALKASGTARASPATSATAPGHIRTAIMVPRFGGDATADWYPSALLQLADLGIRTRVVSLLPEATAPGIDDTVAAIERAVGDDPDEIAQTILIGHSVGGRALLAYLSRQGTFTADWRANAADWPSKLGATVHIVPGAGPYMTGNPGPVLSKIQVASLRAMVQ